MSTSDLNGKQDEMSRRYVSIWFRYLQTDWFSLRHPQLHSVPFILRSSDHGRMIVSAVNEISESRGIFTGMVLADARAIHPDLHVIDAQPEIVDKLLMRLAEWCIRFTPLAGIDPPDGVILDATGCPHLWGGDESYVKDITSKLKSRGYNVRVAMADTIGAAWAIARYGHEPLVAEGSLQTTALLSLPPEALRLEAEVADRLHKLGLHQIKQFINLSRDSLRRRFGVHFLIQLDRSTGYEIETFQPVQPPVQYQERLPCLEPIITLTGIEIALQKLLETLCLRLQRENKGLRTAVFSGHRVDGKVETVSIGTHRPSHHVNHLLKLFELNLSTIEPSLGIELFVIEATKVEDYYPSQEKMWEEVSGLNDIRLSELIDRLAGKIGKQSIKRYLPDEHSWPERSIKEAGSVNEISPVSWRSDILRPLMLLRKPESIEVTAPIPDYPPMLFRHNGRLHKIVRADGPERIEQEWWIQQGQHRDYYRVEDEDGKRYWLFRLGHYHDKAFQWFLHGFFA